jgi:hypothetical protein
MASTETALTPYDMNDAGDPLAQSPEVRLWRAQIYCAIDDLLHNDWRRVDARRWIRSDKQHIGSFRWVCHTLDLDCSAVRRSLTSEKLSSRDGRSRGPRPIQLKLAF